MEQVRRRLDELAERRLLTGLTRQEHDEYQTLVDLEARHLSQRWSSDAPS